MSKSQLADFFRHITIKQPQRLTDYQIFKQSVLDHVPQDGKWAHVSFWVLRNKPNENKLKELKSNGGKK